jgi:predicted DCC family thiol-disulfide oxidoreductase YuxK
MDLPADKAIVLYDGVCGLCDRVVQFVLPRDRRDHFRFATLQGELGHEVLARHGRDASALDTFYVVLHPGTDDEVVYERGRGAVVLLEQLGGIWRTLGRALGVLPTALINVGYRFVARVRYRVFGKLSECRVPTAEELEKFLE